MSSRRKYFWLLAVGILTVVIIAVGSRINQGGCFPTKDNGKWLMLPKTALRKGAQHTAHARIFGKYVRGYNYYILEGIDFVQATAPDGGGYFTGIKAKPTESPIGYELKIFGKSLLDPPRPTSYCSGSTYSAFIEALNRIYGRCGLDSLDYEHYEALRMQEIDGGRREDGIKFWGHWNADGFGNHFALVQYSGIGIVIEPKNARPGDFMNISWKKGGGHSVIFLGWHKDKAGEKHVVYWSSQKGTNGLGDQIVGIDKIKSVKVVRLVKPDQIFHFNLNSPVNIKVPGDKIEF
jgi:hypothetical protein